MRIAYSLAIVMGAAACTERVAPTEPSWQVDVMPLFAANCVRCHAYPFRGDGPGDTTTALRLDSFDDTELADGNIASGASKSVQSIFRHTHGVALLPNQRTMPPDRPLDAYELAVIRNWAALGNGETAVRGPGHPDNRVPTLTLGEVARDASSVTFAYEIVDLDHDLVVGTVIGPRVKDDKLEAAIVIGNPTSGRGQFVWDTTGVPAGEHVLSARLDDGADVDVEGTDDFIVVELGSVTLP